MDAMRSTRRAFIGRALVAAAAAWPMRARAADAVVVVEEWRDASPGATGVPTGWRPYETPGGRPAYDFSVVNDDARRALHL
jgi:formylmethanofuran:tetrahydromethanopterin formyltransferase